MVDTYVQDAEGGYSEAVCEPGWVITDIFNATYAGMNVVPAECNLCGSVDIQSGVERACLGKTYCNLMANAGLFTASSAYFTSADPCVGNNNKRVEYIYRWAGPGMASRLD